MFPKVQQLNNHISSPYLSQAQKTLVSTLNISSKIIIFAFLIMQQTNHIYVN